MGGCKMKKLLYPILTAALFVEWLIFSRLFLLIHQQASMTYDSLWSVLNYTLVAVFGITLWVAGHFEKTGLQPLNLVLQIAAAIAYPVIISYCPPFQIEENILLAFVACGFYIVSAIYNLSKLMKKRNRKD